MLSLKWFQEKIINSQLPCRHMSAWRKFVVPGGGCLLSLPRSKGSDFHPWSTWTPGAGQEFEPRGVWALAGTKPAPGLTLLPPKPTQKPLQSIEGNRVGAGALHQVSSPVSFIWHAGCQLPLKLNKVGVFSYY